MPRPRIRVTAMFAGLLVGAGVLSGCGTTSMKRLGDPSGAHCPTASTGDFHAERFAAHIGVAAGTFRRWVWRPYRAGELDVTAAGREATVARALAGAHAAALEYRAAARDVSVDPTRCELMYAPLTDLANALDKLDRTLHQQDQSRIDRTLTSMHAALDELRTLVRSSGIRIGADVGSRSGHRAKHHHHGGR